jgi:hypothetical protein
MKVSSKFPSLLLLFVWVVCNGCALPFASPVKPEVTPVVPITPAEPRVTAFPEAWLTAPLTYYVAASHPASSDKNPGSSDLPWKTIQHAAAIATGNTRVLVKAGVYHERVTIVHSGLPPGILIFFAESNLSTQGFILNGNYMSVIGFRI